MNLAQYTEALAALPPDLPVFFDSGAAAGTLISWRGRYNELSIDDGYEARPSTVAHLLHDAQDADGRIFVGYKGGEYTMGADTAVWADSYGDCLYNIPVALTPHADRVVIATVSIEEYA